MVSPAARGGNGERTSGPNRLPDRHTQKHHCERSPVCVAFNVSPVRNHVLSFLRLWHRTVHVKNYFEQTVLRPTSNAGPNGGFIRSASSSSPRATPAPTLGTSSDRINLPKGAYAQKTRSSQ